jgi:hypothetical protein
MIGAGFARLDDPGGYCNSLDLCGEAEAEEDRVGGGRRLVGEAVRDAGQQVTNAGLSCS